MGLLSDIIISVPIGITYNIIIHKTGEILNDNKNYKDKIQKNLLLSFGGGMFGIIMASVLFGDKSKYKNRAVRLGLYIGSTLLLIHSIGYNWTLMENDTKIIIMIITLASLIWYTYSSMDHVSEYSTHGEVEVNALPAVYPIRYSEQFDDTEDF